MQVQDAVTLVFNRNTSDEFRVDAVLLEDMRASVPHHWFVQAIQGGRFGIHADAIDMRTQ